MPPNGPRGTILIVDDEPDMLALMASLVQTAFSPERIAVASNGEDALSRLAEGNVSMLLSDYHMPGMDGLALIREYRKGNPTGAAVLLTAFADSQLESNARASGATAFFKKPVNPVQLLRCLHDLDQGVTA